MRPGAGYLPTLALGRPRGPPTGARHVRVPSRRPRQVYRLYTEEEFLNADDLLGSEWGEAPRDCSPIGSSAPSPWGRRAGIAAAAALALVAGVVAIDELRHGAGGGRRSAGRMIALGEPGAGRPAPLLGGRSSRTRAIGASRPLDRRAVGRSLRDRGRSPRTDAVQPAARHAVAQAVADARSHPASTTTRAATSVARSTAETPTAASAPATMQAPAPAPTAPAPTATVPTATVPNATAPTESTATATATASSGARARRPEFGFEQ
jgi:hypothetical protein